MILERYPRTLSVAVFATLLAVVMALGLGIPSAIKAGSWVDLLVTAGSLFGISVPTFWFGTMLVILFSVKLDWLPASGYVPATENLHEYLQHLAMPVLSQAVVVGSVTARMVRATLLEILHSDYIRVARAKGLSEQALILRHALKNASVPIVTRFGISLGYMLGGSAIIEILFAFPGIGQLVLVAITSRDYVLVQGVVLAYALSFIVINTVTDIVCGWLDPRIRFE
jgi:peptide/nickel transport system permease protein